ncbi:DUF6787 family protein [Tenacibaculum crassostreae]|uniref:DUF6787 family protein n=1 Tax=Tenacibaculum crassostreae TaxID=502683 RepID=UPI0038939E49
MEKLKQRWGLKTNWDVIAVLCVFAINGSFAAKIGGPILDYFNITPENTSTWLRVLYRILLIFPIYQTTLPLVGWLFGQFKFFWNFEKKFLSRLGLGFLFKN